MMMMIAGSLNGMNDGKTMMVTMMDKLKSFISKVLSGVFEQLGLYVRLHTVGLMSTAGGVEQEQCCVLY